MLGWCCWWSEPSSRCCSAALSVSHCSLNPFNAAAQLRLWAQHASHMFWSSSKHFAPPRSIEHSGSAERSRARVLGWWLWPGSAPSAACSAALLRGAALSGSHLMSRRRSGLWAALQPELRANTSLMTSANGAWWFPFAAPHPQRSASAKQNVLQSLAGHIQLMF